MRLVPAFAAALALQTSAMAADEPTPRIVVTGTGNVYTSADRALIHFSVHGEGITSDEAVQEMVTKRKALDSAVGLARAEPRALSVTVQEVRGSGCTRQGYMPQPRLSVGDCAIIGYTADQNVELRTAMVKYAGTIVGLLGRLGAVNPQVESFYLADEADARARATAAALANARAQAESLATGAHVTLARILTVSDGSYVEPVVRDIVVTGSAVPPPPPPPPPAPIAVALNPRAIQTQARVTVTYVITQ